MMLHQPIGIVDRRDFTAFLEGGMIPGVILQSEGYFAAQPVLIDVVKGSADIRPELVERWPKVAGRFEFRIEPGRAQMRVVVSVILAAWVSVQQYLHDRIGSEHS